MPVTVYEVTVIRLAGNYFAAKSFSTSWGRNISTCYVTFYFHFSLVNHVNTKIVFSGWDTSSARTCSHKASSVHFMHSYSEVLYSMCVLKHFSQSWPKCKDWRSRNEACVQLVPKHTWKCVLNVYLCSSYRATANPSSVWPCTKVMADHTSTRGATMDTSISFHWLRGASSDRRGHLVPYK